MPPPVRREKGGAVHDLPAANREAERFRGKLEEMKSPESRYCSPAVQAVTGWQAVRQ